MTVSQNRWSMRFFGGLVAVGLLSLGHARAADVPSPRTTLNLNGTWQVAEGSLKERPAAFGHSVPVPGLVDMARPAFETPGSVVSAQDRGSPWLRPADPLREAFWYRRTFSLPGKMPAVAMLTIHKAAYTTKVFLNGQAIGEHAPSFTPGWFDLRPHLRGDGAENELVVRLGASLAQVPAHVNDGWDNEKSRYVPGIYDSVKLVLSGTPHVVNVQTVPDVQASAVLAVVELANAGPAVAGKVKLSATVREVKSGRVAGEIVVEATVPAAGKTCPVEVKIPLPDGHLWTPEDPFLYELTVDTGADRCKTRFGLRSFAADPATGRFLLNGKPYYLRGSNVCIYRFFEDAARGGLPWDENWVRTLHRKFKEMHWNSLRYCIGFPPERWYEIADEEGIMIQDEFPIWYSRAKGGWPEAITTDALTVEFTEWMRERWNHPCVVIWDAQNETKNDRVTGETIQRVRALDRSNRPWDNGWGSPQTPGDVWECHPYRSRPGFTLSKLATANPVPNSVGPRKFDNVALINEYGWLWINRDGSLPTLTVEIYKRIFGEDSTPAQRWHYYALTLAAKTEFWRCHRKCGGVLHFCGLGYSRPDGQTSDNFIDIQKLTYEPEFYRYVRDAFSPVGIMLDFWKESVAPGEKLAVPVKVINDLDRDWAGAVRLRLMEGNECRAEQSKPLSVTALGEAEVAFEVPMSEELKDYTLEAALVREGDPPVCSLRDFAVRKPLPNLALGRPAIASSEVRNTQGFFPAKQAVDGDPSTRWSSEFKDGQWLAVDLGGKKSVSGVEISWEKAGASQYAIEVSDDGQTWREVAREMKGTCGEETLKWSPVETRWIRVRALRRASAFGVSIWELRVF